MGLDVAHPPEGQSPGQSRPDRQPPRRPGGNRHSRPDVHLKGYGLIRLFLIVAPDGDREYGATNDLNMKALTRVRFAGYAWTIETYHRGIKQYCSIERAQVRAARAQRNHIQLAVRAFLRREWPCYQTGLSWFEAKPALIRPALRAYLANPLYTLPTTA